MHKIDKKIYYHDTDCGGVVYYANYFKYFEEARTEYFSDKGVDIKQLSENNTLFAVRKIEVNFKSPARYGEQISVTTKIVKLKNASLDFFQEVKRQDIILVSAVTQIACICCDFRPQIIPEAVMARIK